MTVLAAASLTESFDALKTDFEAANPGVTVETSYGSSATLVQQVNNGAPASVIALAGTSAAEPLDQSLVRDTRTFATNVLEIATPPDNPANVTSIDDLARPTVKVVLCADTVPCGKAAAGDLPQGPRRAQRRQQGGRRQGHARQGQARRGRCRSGLPLRRRRGEGRRPGVEIPPQFNTSLDYPVITLTDDAATRAFVAYLLSAAGLATVQAFGFGAP